MAISSTKMEGALNQLLAPHKIKDYCPNGLQIEGKSQIQKVVTGVTACQELIDIAIAKQADAILVHHGYFWKGEPEVLKGMKRERIAALIKHDINLFAYHLPLDVHPELGNNAQLAQRLGIKLRRGLEPWDPLSVAQVGKFAEPITPQELSQRLNVALEREPLWIDGNKPEIRSVAICTGGGQNYIDLAASQGIDAFISGEVSERTVYTAREMNIHYYSAGHHATERYGVQAVGEWLAENYGLDVEYVEINNPV